MSKNGLKGRKVLVTGAGGFIGLHLVERLRHEKAVVETFSRKDSLQDIKETDFVCHLASSTPFSSHSAFGKESCKKDIAFSKQLAEKALGVGLEKFLFMSGTVVYDLSKSARLNELSPAKPSSLYGKTKLRIENILKEAFAPCAEKLVVLRPTSIYGPGQVAKGLIPSAIDSALQNRPIMVDGSGEMKKDYLFVGDCIDAIVKALLHGKGTYCLGSGTAVSIKEIVEKIKGLTGSDSEIVYSNQGGKEPEISIDVSKAEKEFGWNAKTALEEGLGQQIEWAKQNSMGVE